MKTPKFSCIFSQVDMISECRFKAKFHKTTDDQSTYSFVKFTIILICSRLIFSKFFMNISKLLGIWGVSYMVRRCENNYKKYFELIILL